MRSDPLVVVTCETCGEEDKFELTALAGACYDERGIKSRLRRAGWIEISESEHYCSPECEAEARSA